MFCHVMPCNVTECHLTLPHFLATIFNPASYFFSIADLAGFIAAPDVSEKPHLAGGFDPMAAERPGG
jgi:hypothetical protein